MTAAEVLKLVLMGSIVLTVFALALRAHADDAFYLFREWRLGLRALLAMFVVVPAVALAIIALFDLRPPVEIAILALALSPIPPLLPKKQVKAGSSASYITGLLVAASLASIVLTPLGLWIAGDILSVDVHLSPARVATVLGIGVLAPLVTGLACGKLLGPRAHAVSDGLAKLANILFLGSVAALLFALAPAMWKVIGDGTLVALIAMILTGLAAGYLLAGDRQDEKIALSLATAARHPGIAIAIASANFPEARLAPAAIVLSAVLNALISIPCLGLLAKAQNNRASPTRP